MKKVEEKSGYNRWVRDPVKERYWRQQLARWQKSGLSIRSFCREQKISETSFYAWRRELIIRSRENGSVDKTSDAAQMTPTERKDSRGRIFAIRYRQTDQPASQPILMEETSPNPFVPIRIISGVESKAVPGSISTNPDTTPIKPEVEIALPGGAIIRLNGNCNVQLVAELLSALKG